MGDSEGVGTRVHAEMIVCVPARVGCGPLAWAGDNKVLARGVPSGEL